MSILLISDDESATTCIRSLIKKEDLGKQRIVTTADDTTTKLILCLCHSKPCNIKQAENLLQAQKWPTLVLTRKSNYQLGPSEKVKRWADWKSERVTTSAYWPTANVWERMPNGARLWGSDPRREKYLCDDLKTFLG